MDSMPVLPNNFSFGEASYKIEEYRKEYENVSIDTVYLDVNSSWSLQEFNAILEACKSKTAFGYSGKLVKITSKNRSDLFNELHSQNFSLFPFHKIRSTENALVITKGTQASPNLSDLSGSEFADKLRAWFLKSNKPRLFNIGHDKSPYIKTLKELRAFVYDEGNVGDLTRLLNENKFVIHPENNNTIAIWDASIKIVRTEGTSPGNAPDHLMRLFAYNHVISQAGTRYLEKDFYDAAITDHAYKAWVVSPFTSLVVLETQADYKRFGISDEGTSLKNASMKSAGAVPEPHEWILILVVAAFVIILYIKNK
jgi:XrtN system VIT domain protein